MEIKGLALKIHNDQPIMNLQTEISQDKEALSASKYNKDEKIKNRQMAWASAWSKKKQAT